MHLPKNVLVLDVETTGLSTQDKVVSFGAVSFDSSQIEMASEPSFALTHLIFDPGVPSHPQAEKVHGYSDWVLRHQHPFPLYAGLIRSLIARHDLIVAHNARFDTGFLSRELRAAGETWPEIEVYCTMQAARDEGLAGSLDAACKRAGIASRGKRHSALDDAWRAMQVFLCQMDLIPYDAPEAVGQKPANLKRVPRKPKSGVLSRNSTVELRRIEELAATVHAARRDALPALAVLRWVACGAEAVDGELKGELLAFARAEVTAYLGGLGDEFADALYAEVIAFPSSLAELEGSIEAFRSDADKRNRLSVAIERCIRVDGKIAGDEISRLRQLAAHLGGQIRLADGT